MHCKFIYLLLSLMVIGLTQGSPQFPRFESSQDNKNKFNLAITLSSDTNSNSHHALSHPNLQHYPYVAQQPFQQSSFGNIPIQGMSGCAGYHPCAVPSSSFPLPATAGSIPPGAANLGFLGNYPLQATAGSIPPGAENLPWLGDTYEVLNGRPNRPVMVIS